MTNSSGVLFFQVAPPRNSNFRVFVKEKKEKKKKLTYQYHSVRPSLFCLSFKKNTEKCADCVKVKYAGCATEPSATGVHLGEIITFFLYDKSEGNVRVEFGEIFAFTHKTESDMDYSRVFEKWN